MEKLQLKTTIRDLTKTVPEKLRKDGIIPAELYGHKTPNLHLAISLNEFEKILRKAGESTIIELLSEDGKPHNVIIHDVQRHFLNSQPIHVDFYEVSMTEKLTATVPLEFEGESPAVKALGGVLVKVLDEVEVECLPSDLPHSLTVDISKLESFEDSIHVRDLSVSKGVEIITDAEETIAKVQPPRNVEAELAEPVVEDVSKVEVEGAVPEEGTEEAAGAEEKE